MQVDIYECVTSTQDMALLHLQNGEIGPKWIMARRQTHGLGRMGRVWDDGEGNLMATRYQRLSVSLGTITQLSFVAALAVYDALSSISGLKESLRIKWPNDILHEGAKLCGILINSESHTLDQIGVAIGIGINIQSAPTFEAYRTTCILRAVKIAPEPLDILKLIDTALDIYLRLWLSNGFDEIRNLWLKHAYGVETPIPFKRAMDNITGQVIGLNDTGELIIIDALGVEHILTATD